jgi:hypothetical protein
MVHHLSICYRVYYEDVVQIIGNLEHLVTTRDDNIAHHSIFDFERKNQDRQDYLFTTSVFANIY